VAPFEQADILFPAKERKEGKGESNRRGKGRRGGKGNRKGKGCSPRAKLSGFAELTRPPELAGLADFTKLAELTEPTDFTDLAGIAEVTEFTGSSEFAKPAGLAERNGLFVHYTQDFKLRRRPE